jgi:hypothetical protein
VTLLGLAASGLLAHRMRRLEAIWRDPLAAQERTLARLVRTARTTAWGQAHDYTAIRTIADYQRRVPLGRYLDFRPLWERAIQGEDDVTWPGRPAYYAKTSGTTAGDKLIPVTEAALRSHRRGGLDTLLLALRRAGDARRLDGPMLFLGGSTHLEPAGPGAWVGDLSGIAVRHLPFWLRGRYLPGPELAAIPDWEPRLRATARRAAGADLRLISGMPSWMLVLFERVRAVAAEGGRAPASIGEVWPRLEVFVHGGVRMDPYRRVLEAAVGRPLHYLEVYPASEGFVAIQVEAGDPALTLMLDYDIFYEFVPLARLGDPAPRRLTVAEVRLDEAYAVVLTTAAGLWSYVLGDTVRFVGLDPPRLIITGRTRHFVNAFGENVIVEEVERAAAAAALATGAELVEFTVAPAYPGLASARGCHQWVVEFRRPPADAGAFARALDQTLQRLNTDYRTKRNGSVGMAAPIVVPVTPGTFHRWLAARGQLGDQHKVPRVSNRRDLLDEIVAAQGGETR